MQHAYWSYSSFLQNIIKICLRVSKLWSAGEITTYRRLKWELSLLHVTCLLVLLLICTKYYHISNSIRVMACTRFRLQVRQLHTEESESCLSCTRHSFWSSSSSLRIIIKLSQLVWELWPAQNFGFRGDNYTTITVGVITLARDTPTGPPLHFYQTLSKYV